MDQAHTLNGISGYHVRFSSRRRPSSFLTSTEVIMLLWYPRSLASRSRGRARLMLHALEGRVVPATFTVTNDADAGAGSLRQAILDANARAGADDVAFDPAFFNAANPR